MSALVSVCLLQAKQPPVEGLIPERLIQKSPAVLYQVPHPLSPIAVYAPYKFYIFIYIYI